MPDRAKGSLQHRTLVYMTILGALLNAAAAVGFAGLYWPGIGLGGLFGAIPFVVLFAWHDRRFALKWLCRAWRPSIFVLGALGLALLLHNALNAEEILGGEQMSVMALPVLLLILYLGFIALAEAVVAISNVALRMVAK